MNKKRFYILDVKKEYYWVTNNHYGYTLNNQPVFKPVFSTSFSKATFLTEKAAEQILAKFYNCESIMSEVEFNIADLRIREIID